MLRRFLSYKSRKSLQKILTQVLDEFKEELGGKYNVNKINLAELERKTGITRGKLRALKANGFVIKPHGLTGRVSNNNIINAYSGVLDDLLSRGISNSSVCHIIGPWTTFLTTEH